MELPQEKLFAREEILHKAWEKIEELKKLSEKKGETYTSFPIPIIEREHLESIELDLTKSFIKMNGIHFYILFNENLLDEEKMQEMITQKQKEAEAVKESIQICKQEYEDYFHRFEQIKGQKITEKLWEDIQKKLQKLEKESYQEVQQEKKFILNRTLKK